MAATFSSVKYAGRAPAGHVLLRAFVGGALQPELLQRDDPALLDLVRRERRALLGVQAAPLFTRIARYPHSMPQYRVGHLRRVAEIEACIARYPGLALPAMRIAASGWPTVCAVAKPRRRPCCPRGIEEMGWTKYNLPRGENLSV